jgi:hypothetical protein
MKRKNFQLKKRGSLNLSIEAIVIVVIAFTVLGLGLAFVKNQLGGIGKTTSEVQTKIKEQILEDMRTSGKKLSIAQQIQLERGKETVENVGIVNTGTQTGTFGIRITPIKGQRPNGNGITIDEMIAEISFFYSGLVDKTLPPTGGDVIPVTISARSSASGNYLYKVEVYQSPECSDTSVECPTPYDTRSFFVKVG